MLTRKEMLKLMASFPVVGSLAHAGIVTKTSAAEVTPPIFRRDYFRELGLRPFINGRGTITTLSGSLMEPEVLDAINYAAQQFVDLNELNRKVGERIAEMLQCEAAHVSAGAASAITLATAATMTGTDPAKVRAIPNLPGPQREVVLQRTHRIYEQQLLACGVKLVEVEGAAEMERAINENTVMAFFFNAAPEQSISREEFVRIGKAHGVPTFLDAAADVPPVDNLFKYIRMGFDLVTFSGGKGIRGPQSTGLLFGRKELIEAARMNHSPSASIGRGMKVNKEEILGMMVALEVYLAKDHEAEWRMWESWVEQIAGNVHSVPSVVTESYVPPVANHVPHLRITWNQDQIRISPAEVRETLRNGHPSIEIFGGPDSLEMNVFMMQPKEIGIVGRRIKEHLEGAVAS